MYQAILMQVEVLDVEDKRSENMKIFALVILFLLLFNRIKTTPSMLSKRLYRKRMQKTIDKQGKEEISGTMQGAAILLVLLMELFLIIFYGVLGGSIGTTTFIVLSALQIVTCIWTTLRNLADFKSAFSKNIDDYKFYRWYFMFNVVLDYIYYPLAIYMLLK